MNEFRYGSYCTEYFANIEEGRHRIKMGEYACFSNVFRWLSANGKPSTIQYQIVLYKGCDYARRYHKNNACLLNCKELRSHIDQLKGLVSFKCRIKSINDDNPRFIVNITVINASPIQHKYLLTWIRYAYEFPFNVSLLEARKLRNEKEFRFESGFNLFNIVSQCLDIWGGGHAIASGNEVELIKKNVLKTRLDGNPNSRLNTLFGHTSDGRLSILEREHVIDKRVTIYDTEYWESDQLFKEKRLPVYKKRLKYLRKK